MAPSSHLPAPSSGARSALITGITGQDGSYLAELLLSKGYAVHGLVRRASMFNRSRIEHLRAKREELKAEVPAPAFRDEVSREKAGRILGGQQAATVPSPSRLPPPTSASASLTLHYGDLSDLTSLRRLLKQIKPDEVYHLAGQSHIGLSFEIPEVTCEENGMATLGLLEALHDLDHPVRFYHAASSEIFGAPASAPQNETTPFNPVNPYGCAKAFAVHLCHVYRNAYGLFACSGLSYNHESPRRGENFVTRKITLGAARIKAGLQGALHLGNLEAKRDWGYAPEYVEAMWRMLQQDKPRDYVLATGKACSIREFAIAAFDELGIRLEFESTGLGEFARRKDTDEVVLTVDPKYFRPAEPSELVGDASLARKELGWAPKTAGTDVARIMARADFAALAEG
ncbi:MAG TPA: GDP-mannose 4,6-dehydratase [Lacunisphaera sp.]|nr:GDP-mannose 4,6-dehydratase [Lacunisphaera sp.]